MRWCASSASPASLIRAGWKRTGACIAHGERPMKSYSIATIPGDGIGKEVVPAGQRVLEALAAASTAFRFEFENFGWGGDWFRAHGEMMPADGLDALRGKDAILF